MWRLAVYFLWPLTAWAEGNSLSHFTGESTRVVWVQDHSRTRSDTLAMGQRLRLMKSDGAGEKALLPEFRNYVKPLLNANGQKIVYSDHQSQKFHVINWDGTGKKLLGEGLAIEVWKDPQTAMEWVYFAKRVGKAEDTTYRTVRRIPLDDPRKSEKVWDATDVGRDNFQLSADGLKAGGEFPWPNGGIADLSKKSWKKLDQGCWASLAPDNSYLNWVFDGPHRNLQFHRPDQSEGWKVPINTAMGLDGHEVFHPRWTNHVRYLVLTGPYVVQGPVNLISGGGPAVEIHLGRFSPDFRNVEAWHKITDNEFGDFYPDVWIERGETSRVELPGLVTTPSSVVQTETRQPWPVIREGLIAAWDNSKVGSPGSASSGTAPQPCQPRLHGQAYFNRHFAIHCAGGSVTLDGVQEAISKAWNRDAEISVEFLLTPSGRSMVEVPIVEWARQPREPRDGSLLPIWKVSQKGLDLVWEDGVRRSNRPARWEQALDSREIEPRHVVIETFRDRLEIFLDGKRMTTGAVSKPPSSIQQPPSDKPSSDDVMLRFGSPQWQGSIEAIAVFDRPLSEPEVLTQSTASRSRLAGRKPVARGSAVVRRLESNTIPTPESILPYRRALSLEVFEILKVGKETKQDAVSLALSNSLQSGQKILIARWVILDGKTLVNASGKVGETIQVDLERLEDHPELDGERQIQETTELDLPAFYSQQLLPSQD